MSSGGSLLPVLASTCGALLLCIAMVSSGMRADEVGSGEFMLMDWGSLQASQQMQQYRAAFQLDSTSVGPSMADSDRSSSPAQSSAKQELDNIERVTNHVLPKSAKGKGLHSATESADQMLSHYSSVNKAVFPKESKTIKHNERESGVQELKRLRTLSAAVWPQSKHSAHKGGKATAAQLLSHYKAINNRVFPKEHARAKHEVTAEQELQHLKALSASVLPKSHIARRQHSTQNAQDMLKHYAAVNNMVFPKEKATRKHVQDV